MRTGQELRQMSCIFLRLKGILSHYCIGHVEPEQLETQEDQHEAKEA